MQQNVPMTPLGTEISSAEAPAGNVCRRNSLRWDNERAPASRFALNNQLFAEFPQRRSSSVRKETQQSEEKKCKIPPADLKGSKMQLGSLEGKKKMS